MRRVFWFWRGRHEQPQVAWHLSEQQHEQLLKLLSELGLQIVGEARGPVPLLTFGRRVLEQLNPGPSAAVPLPHFADALKHVIRDMDHDRLRVMSPTDFLGVGYVYNASDPDTWPFKSRW